MNAINVALSVRNNILQYLNTLPASRPGAGVTTRDFMDSPFMPEGVARAPQTVQHAFEALRRSGELVREAIPHPAFQAPRYHYRLRTEQDPAPAVLETKKPRRILRKHIKDSNAVAEQLRSKKAAWPERTEEIAKLSKALDEVNAELAQEKMNALSKEVCEMINARARVDVQVTTTGITIRLGDINITITA